MSNGLGTKGAAKTPAMAKLHDQLAKELSKIIKDGETVVVAGKTHKVKASAAILNVARAFLKDNDVTVDDGVRPTEPVLDLAEELANVNADADDGAPQFKN
jgi:hypothetical protein